jgi:alpha-D-ribose 1-methylphosphonate 5-triphosphate synthase subunit PhnL
MRRDPVLDVRRLSKSFILHAVSGREVIAFNDVSFNITVGEHVALAGMSGAGKSSLLKCIYRTYRPNTGEVWLQIHAGEYVDMCALSDVEIAAIRGHEIGYVSQFLRSEPRRGALDIVVKSALQRGMNHDDAHDAAKLALQRVGIEPRLWDVYASVLSGGEKQRVNLAAGTVHPPRLLLLDEPLSALDPENRALALDLISSLSHRGVAVVSIFHDLEAIQRLASRVLVMEKGRLIAERNPQELDERLAAAAR